MELEITAVNMGYTLRATNRCGCTVNHRAKHVNVYTEGQSVTILKKKKAFFPRELQNKLMFRRIFTSKLKETTESWNFLDSLYLSVSTVSL